MQYARRSVTRRVEFVTLLPRGYSALFKGIAAYELKDFNLAQPVTPYLIPPKAHPFWLLATDVTPHPCPYRYTLQERSFIYQLTLIRGTRPISIGHQYSTVGRLAEKTAASEPAWVIPLRVQPVPVGADKELLGTEQLHALTWATLRECLRC